MTALLDAILDSVPNPMWLVAHDGSIVRTNRAFERVREILLGDDYRAICARALEGSEISTSAGAYTVSATPVVEHGRIAGVVFSAQERDAAHGGARDDLFELSLTRLFIDDERPLMRILVNALEYLCRSDGWDEGTLWLTGDDVLEPAATFPDDAALDPAIAARAWTENDLAQNVAGGLAVPLRDGMRVIGVLALAVREPRPVETSRARALLRHGNALGRLIQRRRAEDERKHLLQVIERKGLEWTLTFDAIELPIFIATFDGAVRRMNRAARDLAGGDYVDALGRRIRDLGPGEPWITLAASFEAVRDSGEECTAQAHHAIADRTWDIAATSYHPADQPPRVILIAREVTNVVRLQSAVRRGEQLSALGELVAAVAHEVRNPIFGIRMTLDSLESTIARTREVDEQLLVLRRWLDRLTHLMESLLAYGRTWNINLQQGSVGPVLRHVIDSSETIASAAAVRLRADIDTTHPVLMDAARLVHAFENLLGNAIQHASAGSEVVVVAHEVDGFVECIVRDHGPGFADEDLPRIFEPFFSRRPGGTGLGLAIVQRIVEEHGGIVTACNAADRGAIVTVRLPLYQAG